ncbi:aldehyde dehydrogenase domain-containing protein [Dioszegia hungarica]|uniref:Aldehyde dehydrogenase domain-containing protein n=1 Tax=Dioszegia hungarica TaxID=4972 RepID=A0AA38LT13_9TREE|nr:aldehyde dehydrogenase domain-containing protein [Dioszegia hungarica]KAI9634243.1 aldehyde dehydrogenase domain-containing protein [Dioszegia hungarica]
MQSAPPPAYPRGSTHAEVDVPTLGRVELPVGLFIDNTWRPASTGSTFSTVNPATGESLLSIAHASSEDVDAAVKSARLAFKTTWGNNVHAAERGAALNRLADLMERDKDRLAAVESLNSGKGIRMARDSDVADSIGCLRYYAGLADKFHGQTIPHYGTEKFVYTVHQPIGVCGQIIPWNYPLLMWAWKVAPALAAGCCVIMKPSELTPLTALMLCDLAKEAGIPSGVMSTLPGLGSTTGDAIARHMDIDKIAFTGSVVTGRKISVAAAESNLKKVTLELGGKSPIMVFDSAHVEKAADWTAMGIWFNSGQDCCAGSRVYVQDGVYEEFAAALKKRAEATGIGMPSDDKTSFGPLISEVQRDKVMTYIEGGKEQGARVVTGGKRWAKSDGGFWVEPTILADVHDEMTCVKEEIFGPVIALSRFTSESEALERANSTTYGLAAAVFTRDTQQAMRMSAALDAGTVWVNQYALIHPGAPFGGFKQSGVGRELGTYGLEAYTQVKAVHHNLSQTVEWPL